ncbi:MAG: formimidoylglutamate deiminase [Edaphocola sp.]
MYRFKGLLTENGWLENAVVSLGTDGNITDINTDTHAPATYVDGYAVPGFQNAHSHAFQYAMAGLAEYFEGPEVPDDFWSWRNAMYRVALALDPADMETVATMLYAEMLRNGYTSVAEFHYVHHDENGKKYNNLAEMGERLVAAAQRTGIRITLVPICYQTGNFGIPSYDLQRRFISHTIEEYYQLFEASKQAVSHYEHANLAAGAHSLRAVGKEDLIAVSKMARQYPFHIHVAEQLKEINDCQAYYGCRPAEWLLAHCDVNSNYNLVHCTHLADNEVAGIARSGANVVLCPSTEGNLGDGRFRFKEYQQHGGKWSIGTDSQISVNHLEDLRLLDYVQRTNTHRRDTFFHPQRGDSGFNALHMAHTAGRAAMGEKVATPFAIGQSFDAVIIDAQAPLIATSSLKNICNTLVYAGDTSHLMGTMVAGKWVAQNNKHQHHEAIAQEFMATMKRLKLR